MFRKVITYFLITAVVLPVLASAVPFGAKISYAQEEETTVTETITTTKGGESVTTSKTTKLTSGDGEVINPCGWTLGVFKGAFWDCVAYTAVYLSYELIMNVSIWITGWASDLFNVSIQFSLTGESFDADKNIMIKDGWTFVRDLLNLVFIFILLFAAISTILQYGNMDIKKILPSLIVVALLVNFSMMIAKMVIDASHIFAWEFYNQINVTDGGKVPNLQSSVNVDKYFVKKNLANVFIAGFNPQRVLIGGKTENETIKGDAGEEAEKSSWKQVVARATEKGEPLIDTLWRVVIIVLFESALALLAAFILLAGAIMFIIRVVVLWLVIIFSPIAFLGMILPKMDEYSKMWWSYLIGQSFFAPAFLFMFMLATKFIDNKLIDSLLMPIKNNDSNIVTGLNMGEIILISFNFLIVGGLMMACLIVARQLGGKAADFGISWAHKGKGLALGVAAKSPGKIFDNRLARWLYGQFADKTLDKEKGWGEKRWAKTLTAIPGVGIGLRKLGAMKKSDEDKARKAAEKYAGTLSGAGRQSLDIDKGRGLVGRALYGGGVFKPTREGYEKIIEKKKAEDEERGRIALKVKELMGSKYDEFKGALSDNDAIEKAKGILFRGNFEVLDRLIEAEDKEFEKKNKEERDGIIGKKRDLKIKIKSIEDTIARYRAAGQPRGVAAYEEELKKAYKEQDDYEEKMVAIVMNEKHRDNLQKIVDKYEGKQNIRSGKPEEKKEEKKEESKT